MVLPLSRSTDAVSFCALFAGEAFIGLRHVTETSGHNDSAVPHKMFWLQAMDRRLMKDCDGTHTCVFRRSWAAQSVFRQASLRFFALDSGGRSSRHLVDLRCRVDGGSDVFASRNWKLSAREAGMAWLELTATLSDGGDFME